METSSANYLYLQKLSHSIAYHAYTIWLFTFSDIKTTILPTSTFGLVGALSGQPLLSGPLSLSVVIARAPHVLFWTWSTLLPFAINNQSGHSAILEDSLNKPWRPLPSQRISSRLSYALMTILYCANILVSYELGALPQALSMLSLGIWYNRLGGADRGCLEKNFINALGYMSFITGALKVTANTKTTGVSFGPIALPWFVFIGLVIFTTVHAQDFEDMDGDAARERNTVPLVIGERAARLILALAVPLWSGLIPWYFQSNALGYLGPNIMAAVVGYRFLLKRTIGDDKISFRFWNVWIVSLYVVPFYVGA